MNVKQVGLVDIFFTVSWMRSMVWFYMDEFMGLSLVFNVSCVGDSPFVSNIKSMRMSLS